MPSLWASASPSVAAAKVLVKNSEGVPMEIAKLLDRVVAKLHQWQENAMACKSNSESFCAAKVSVISQRLLILIWKHMAVDSTVELEIQEVGS